MRFLLGLAMLFVCAVIVGLVALFLYEFALILFTTTYGRALLGLLVLAVIYAAIKKETAA